MSLSGQKNPKKLYLCNNVNIKVLGTIFITFLSQWQKKADSRLKRKLNLGKMCPETKSNKISIIIFFQDFFANSWEII